MGKNKNKKGNKLRVLTEHEQKLLDTNQYELFLKETGDNKLLNESVKIDKNLVLSMVRDFSELGKMPKFSKLDLTKYLAVDNRRDYLSSTGVVRYSDFGFGDVSKVQSPRLETFKKDTHCICCGLEGSYFKKTYSQNTYHLNFFGTSELGNEVLFTKDHIIPKSKGGKNESSNYVTCCTHCNCLKDNLELSWKEVIDLVLANDFRPFKHSLNGETKQLILKKYKKELV